MTRRHLLIAAVAIFAVFMAVQWLRWSGAAGAGRAQEKFIAAVDGRRWSKCHAMVSEDYSDRWGYGRDEISLALQDAARVFSMSWDVRWETAEVEPDGSGFRVVGTAQVSGEGPGARFAAAEIRKAGAEPFAFRWRREGFLPWKWKLVGIEHPTLSPPRGYKPGQLDSMLGGF